MSDRLTCISCQNELNIYKHTPKKLSCQHTICQECTYQQHEKFGCIKCSVLNCQVISRGNPNVLKVDEQLCQLIEKKQQSQQQYKEDNLMLKEKLKESSEVIKGIYKAQSDIIKSVNNLLSEILFSSSNAIMQELQLFQAKIPKKIAHLETLIKNFNQVSIINFENPIETQSILQKYEETQKKSKLLIRYLEQLMDQIVKNLKIFLQKAQNLEQEITIQTEEKESDNQNYYQICKVGFQNCVINYFTCVDLQQEIDKRKQEFKDTKNSGCYFSEDKIWRAIKNLIQNGCNIQLGNAARPYLLEQDSTVLGNYLDKSFNSQIKKLKEFPGKQCYLCPWLLERYEKIIQGELVKLFPYNQCKSNVFSLGISLLEMASLEDIQDFNKENGSQYIAEVMSRLSSRYSMKTLYILNLMLVHNKNNRPDFEQLQQQIEWIENNSPQ